MGFQCEEHPGDDTDIAALRKTTMNVVQNACSRIPVLASCDSHTAGVGLGDIAVASVTVTLYLLQLLTYSYCMQHPPHAYRLRVDALVQARQYL